MPIFSKRTVLVVLVFAILLSILLRYPLVEHERYQADSYYIHLLSQSLVDDGYAKWTLHPLSYVGYYPLSYPSGMPFLIAETSALTGLTVEICVLLVGLIIGALFCLVMFCLARQFLTRVELALLATILATVAPRFVDTTFWVGSARAPAMVFLVLIVFVCFRYGLTGKKTLLLLASILIIGCFSMHHMAIVLILFGACYLIVTFGVDHVFRTDRSGRLRNVVGYFAGMVLVLTLITYAFLDLLLKSITYNFGTIGIFDLEPRFVSIFLNLGASYVGQIGLITLVSVLGVVSIFRQSNRTVATLFPLAAVIGFIPVLGQSLYVSMVLMPFLVIIGVHWFGRSSTTRKRTNYIQIFTVLFVISSIMLAAWSTQRWNSSEYFDGNTVEVGADPFNDAHYLSRAMRDCDVVSNVQVLSSQVDAISSVVLLKSGIHSLLNGDLSQEDVAKNTTWSDAPFPTNLYVWFDYRHDQDSSNAVQSLMLGGIAHLHGITEGSVSARTYFSTHTKFVVMIDNRWTENFVTNYGILSASFPSEVCDAKWQSDSDGGGVYSPLLSYLVYRSNIASYYCVELPL